MNTREQQTRYYIGQLVGGNTAHARFYKYKCTAGKRIDGAKSRRSVNVGLKYSSEPPEYAEQRF